MRFSYIIVIVNVVETQMGVVKTNYEKGKNDWDRN